MNREKYLERQRRYNQSEKGRARGRQWFNERYQSDWRFRFDHQYRNNVRRRAAADDRDGILIAELERRLGGIS